MNPIYKPKGAAAEYGDYAVNIYTGSRICFLARRKPWCSITHQKVSM